MLSRFVSCLCATTFADDFLFDKAAIVATGGAEEGNNEVLEADDDAIGAAVNAGLGSGEKNWGELVQNLPLGDDEDETDLGPDGLPRLGKHFFCVFFTEIPEKTFVAASKRR